MIDNWPGFILAVAFVFMALWIWGLRRDRRELQDKLRWARARIDQLDAERIEQNKRALVCQGRMSLAKD